MVGFHTLNKTNTYNIKSYDIYITQGVPVNEYRQFIVPYTMISAVHLIDSMTNILTETLDFNKIYGHIKDSCLIYICYEMILSNDSHTPL